MLPPATLSAPQLDHYCACWSAQSASLLALREPAPGTPGPWKTCHARVYTCPPSLAARRGIAMAPFRLFFPHAIVFGSILKWLRIVPSEQLQLPRQRPHRATAALASGAKPGPPRLCLPDMPADGAGQAGHCACLSAAYHNHRAFALVPNAPALAAPAAPGPRTERDRLAAAPPISIRYSRDLGVLQLTIFVVALGYAGKHLGRKGGLDAAPRGLREGGARASASRVPPGFCFNVFNTGPRAACTARAEA